MNTTLQELDDTEFLRRFHDCTLPPEHFKHRGHLRLAWLVLQQQSLEEAVTTITQAIQAYATHLGAREKFHHTLTEAIVRLMHQRIQNQGQHGFEEFLAHNPDLQYRLTQVLAQHYSPTYLDSPIARQEFLPPDRLPLDAPLPTIDTTTAHTGQTA